MAYAHAVHFDFLRSFVFAHSMIKLLSKEKSVFIVEFYAFDQGYYD